MLLLFCIMSETDSDLGTLVVTDKDDNVSGFSECEIRDIGDTDLRRCVFTDWRTRTRCT